MMQSGQDKILDNRLYKQKTVKQRGYIVSKIKSAKSSQWNDQTQSLFIPVPPQSNLSVINNATPNNNNQNNNNTNTNQATQSTNITTNSAASTHSVHSIHNASETEAERDLAEELHATTQELSDAQSQIQTLLKENVNYKKNIEEHVPLNKES